MEKVKEDYSINKYIRIGFYVFVAVLFVGFICAERFLPSEREPETALDNLHYEGTLFWEKADGSREEIKAPGTYEVASGTTMVITTTLPDEYDRNTIGMRGSQQSVRFYIDGELRSEYDTKNSRPFGSESASRYVFCKTSMADAGKELRIELLSNSEKYSGVVNEIFCGDKMDIWSYIFSVYGTKSVNGLFILFAGIVTIIFSIALSIAYKTKINLEYLGWCIVLGALWLLGESKFRQLFVPNVSSWASMCFVIVMICPLPILFYVDSVQHGRHKKLFGVIEGIAVLNLVVSTILQVAEIADYLDTLFVSHIILGSTFVAVFITFFLDYRRGIMKEYLLNVIGMLLGMAGAFIEVISVYFVVSVSGVFLGTGLLLLLFCTIIKTITDIRELENKRHQEQLEIRRKQTEVMSLQMIQTLSTTIEAKDEYTKGHSHRVAEYAALIAKELGWSEREVENLKNAAHLHDVGKIGIPDTILNKPTKLLDAEYEIIKKHPTIGADILKNITLIEHVEEVARYHHERFDGKGYPEHLKGDEIPIQARIVALADSYDAMNSRRIYRDSLPENVIREEIVKNRGLQFDPGIADVFLKLLDEDRVQIAEESLKPTADGALSEFEMQGTTEAGRFISDVVDTMKSQKNSESLDYLTGLPTRNLGEKQIAEAMQIHGGCLAFLDMDNLKKINDIYGHRAGDRVLRLLGEAILHYAKDNIACRLGGDEFLLFLQDIEMEEASEIVSHIFDSFQERKDQDAEASSASLSGGLCMCVKGDTFAECCTKADKALYYVKRNGKNSFSFYHQIEKENVQTGQAGKDLEQVAKMLRECGNYSGAMDLDHREFAKIYEYVSNLGERYKHTCHLVMITMDAVSDETMYIENIEQAVNCMEMAIRSNIRNVDICTRYSSMQYLVILMEVGEDNIPLVLDRIFTQYYKEYGKNEFEPRYEFVPMLENTASRS